MKKNTRKPHCLIQRGNAKVPVYRRVQRRGTASYVYYQVPDHSTGERKLWGFNSEQKAKEKATEIAEATAQGEPLLLTFSALKRPLQNALEAIGPTGLRIDHACRLIVEACQIIPHEKILEACRMFKRLEPTTPFTPMLVKDAIEAYLALPKKVGWRRKKTVASQFNVFARQFGTRLLHEVDVVEFHDFVHAKPWKPKSFNEFLRTISQLYREAQFRRWVPRECNPTAEIKRRYEPAPEVGILEPAECKQLLSSLAAMEPGLVPAIAIWAFSGIRLEEISRMDWTQVEKGLETGKFVLEPLQTKKQKRRSVPVMDNLRLWLTQFKGNAPTVIPTFWLTPTKTSQNRLGELPRHIQRKTRCIWRDNWGRHSFGTYYFKIVKDAGRVVQVMGNGLKDFERNYWSKADSVTDASAKEWFDIVPETPGNVVPMHETLEKVVAETAVTVANTQ